MHLEPQRLNNYFLQKPFLDSVEHLTEDTVAVFPAANSLEQYVIEVIMSNCNEETGEMYCKKLNLYKVSMLFQRSSSKILLV